ncbi:hypothetical protein JR316_0009031 [Psilocybe cubensis]|uniref:Uncharacterized protein n=2 Tax=Psilocybe cubensis TaxID=181762 RepID=A0ACB8GSY4_PSICU|nr:hypothetical protein JR316_0009031 [Psilocybe cubensis]KAH9478574.1 hypothetical protein JR316_0009031 [Psilocybe cubensis]
MIVNNSICVWDFVSDTKASWTVPLSGNFDRVRVHILLDEFVVLCNSNSIFVWAIPQLHPCGSVEAEVIQDLEPLKRLSLDLRHGVPSSGYNVEILDEWYNGFNQPFEIDIIFSFSEESVEVSRYRLDLPSATNMLAKGEQQICVHEVGEFKLPSDDGYLEEYRISNEHTFMYWSSDRGVNIVATPFQWSKISSAPRRPLQHSMGWHETSPVDRFLMTLCPVSGRMCYASPIDTIRVVDFVAPYM